MEISIKIINAFSVDGTGGNPAGVVSDANGLADVQMQLVAKKVGFSETVFVLPSEKADLKLRYFSPKKEVELCGHATIAAISDFNNGKSEMIIETISGLVSVFREGDFISIELPVGNINEVAYNKEDIAPLLGIGSDEVEDAPIVIASAGVPKLIIPIKSINSLRSITPDLEGIKTFCIENGCKGFYPVTQETIKEKNDFHARQFNPLAGIDEDPITGVAAAALGVYVKTFHLIAKERFFVEQGYTMGHPGEIVVDARNENIIIGGQATKVETLSIDV